MAPLFESAVIEVADLGCVSSGNRLPMSGLSLVASVRVGRKAHSWTVVVARTGKDLAVVLRMPQIRHQLGLQREDLVSESPTRIVSLCEGFWLREAHLSWRVSWTSESILLEGAVELAVLLE